MAILPCPILRVKKIQPEIKVALIEQSGSEILVQAPAGRPVKRFYELKDALVEIGRAFDNESRAITPRITTLSNNRPRTQELGPRLQQGGAR